MSASSSSTECLPWPPRADMVSGCTTAQAFTSWRQHAWNKRRLQAVSEMIRGALVSRVKRAAFNSWLEFCDRSRGKERLRGLADKVRGALQHKAKRAAFSTWQDFTCTARQERRQGAVADKARRALLHRVTRAAFNSWVDFATRCRDARHTVRGCCPPRFLHTAAGSTPCSFCTGAASVAAAGVYSRCMPRNVGQHSIGEDSKDERPNSRRECCAHRACMWLSGAGAIMQFLELSSL